QPWPGADGKSAAPQPENGSSWCVWSSAPWWTTAAVWCANSTSPSSGPRPWTAAGTQPFSVKDLLITMCKACPDTGHTPACARLLSPTNSASTKPLIDARSRLLGFFTTSLRIGATTGACTLDARFIFRLHDRDEPFEEGEEHPLRRNHLYARTGRIEAPHPSRFYTVLLLFES